MKHIMYDENMSICITTTIDNLTTSALEHYHWKVNFRFDVKYTYKCCVD